MLVSFSLQNYRSFASRQAISMVASAGAKRHEGFSFPSGNSFSPYLLRSACLFGPNGAGKSALVGAFDFYKDFIVSSAKDTQEGEKIDISLSSWMRNGEESQPNLKLFSSTVVLCINMVLRLTEIECGANGYSASQMRMIGKSTLYFSGNMIQTQKNMFGT